MTYVDHAGLILLCAQLFPFSVLVQFSLRKVSDGNSGTLSWLHKPGTEQVPFDAAGGGAVRRVRLREAHHDDDVALPAADLGWKVRYRSFL